MEVNNFKINIYYIMKVIKSTIKNCIVILSFFDWRTFKDMPHFEMTGGLTIADFRAGKKPKFAEVKASSAAEVTDQAKEEDNTLQLTAYQWTTVQAKIKALLDAKTINDCSWLEKAEKRTLTASELAWLTFMIA